MYQMLDRGSRGGAGAGGHILKATSKSKGYCDIYFPEEGTFAITPHPGMFASRNAPPFLFGRRLCLLFFPEGGVNEWQI